MTRPAVKQAKAAGAARRRPVAVPRVGFVVHGLAHVEAALAAAREAGRAVLLLSAPQAAATVGAQVFAAMIDEGRIRVPGATALAVLDCGTAAGRALDAIGRRVDAIRVRLKAEPRARVAAIASAAGVRVYDGRVQALDLRANPDPFAACRQWLADCQTGAGAITTRPRAAPRNRTPSR